MSGRRWVGRRLALALALIWLGAAWAGAQASLEDRTLSIGGGPNGAGSVRRYPPALGPLAGPVVRGDTTWLAVGPQLYGYDPRGRVRARLDLPADAADLDDSSGSLRVTVRYGALPETFTVTNAETGLGAALQERAVFPPFLSPDRPDGGDPPTNPATHWLWRAAVAGAGFDALQPPNPAAAQRFFAAKVQDDPSNRVAQALLALSADRAGDHAAAVAAAGAATAGNASINAVPPFFVLVQVAQILDSAGRPVSADLTLNAARLDWARRGYDPALPVSKAALRAYGDPLGYIETLFRSGNGRRLDAWMAYVRDVSPRFGGYRGVYERYARRLDLQDRAGEAAEWRRFSRALDAGSLYNLGPDGLLTARDVARWATCTLALALLAAALTLGTRAWPLQGADLAPLGGRWRAWLLHPLSRARRILLAYVRFGEKLALVAMLAALLITLSAWTWAVRTQLRASAPVLNTGTYGGAWFYDGLDNLGLDNSTEARLLRGLAAQLSGDPAAARDQYLAGPPDACVLNNLGVLAQNRGDDLNARQNYRAALARDPALLAPAYNLNLNPGGFEANFQRQFRSGPRLCYPDLRATYRAADGRLGGEITQIVRDPFAYLTQLPTGLPVAVQWLWVTLLLAGCFVGALWLLVPRPASARGAAHPWLARILGVLLPGTALLDGAWGLVLLLAWSAAGVGLLAGSGWLRFPYLADLAGAAAFFTLLSILASAYVVNLLALVLRLLSAVRRRPEPAPSAQRT